MINPKDDSYNLFDGDDELFKSYIKDADLYFEYGVGKSTEWVLENTKSKIIAVDSDLNWINSIKNIEVYKERLKTTWVDLGKLTKWGRPISYSHRDNFINYINAIWQFDKNPDIVLIDGRFRVACFLYTLLQADKNTVIFFDDYINRPWYHIVEEVIPINKQCGRQGMFQVPKTFNKKLAKDILDKFIYVLD